MADNRVEVLITGDASGLVRATDQAAQAMGSFGASTSKLSGIASAFKSDFGVMTAAFGTASIAVTGIIGAFDGAARALQAMNAEVIDAERVSAKLTATFAGAEGAAARLTAQAEALAGSTVFFDDDAIKSAAAALRAFDLTEKQISQLLPVAVNLATVFGTDLDSAAQKLALGLNGSTRGLREFGIVTKEGATQAEVMAEILKRGEQAAKGATTAQSGLRGATEGLKKAQGEFNQALGNLLAGPQAGFLNFLSSAINKATELTGALSGVASATLAVSKVINPKTGQIESGPAVPTVRPGQRFGEIPGLPMSATGRALAERVLGVETAGGGLQKPVKEPEAPRTPRAARMSPKPAAQEMLGPGIELLQNYQRQQLENLINANIKAGEEQLKFTAAAEDLADERQRARNEEVSRFYDEQQAKMDDLISRSINAASRFVGQLISGQGDGAGLAKGAIGLFGTFAGDIASLIPGISERGIKIVERVAGGLADVMSSLVDRFAQNADELKKAAAKMDESMTQLRQSVEYNAEKAAQAFADKMRPIESYRESEAGRMAGLLGSQAKAAFEFGQMGQQKAGALISAGLAGEGIRASYGALAQTFGNLSSTAMAGLKGELGGQLAGIRAGTQSGFMLSDNIKKLIPAIESYDPTAVQDLLLKLAEYLGAGQPTAEDAAQLGDSARNPVYVFDVSPSKDEFTRAPRGLFFRPVGTGRAVETGSAVSAGAVRGGAGTYGASPRRNLG